MEQPHNNNVNDEEIPEFTGAVKNLVDAAMATAAAFKARSGYREAVQALIAAALTLALAGFLPGLRFHPKDEELLGFFLRKKVRAEAFPVADMMREANVMLHNPMSLAAMLPKLGDREWYFFTPRLRKYRNGERPDRGTVGGYWKATGADKAVSLDGETVGFKKSLVFYLNKVKEGELDRKTKWIMYEYKLNQPPRIQEHEDDMRLDDWVLCSIHEQPPQTRRRVVKRKLKAVDETKRTKRVVKRKQTVKPPAVDDADMDVDVDVNTSVAPGENRAALDVVVNTSVAPDENRALEQPSTSTNVVEADQQYRYQHDQYHRVSTSTNVVEADQQFIYQHDQYLYLPQEQYTYHVPVIDQQEQYVQPYQQYQYLEQPMPPLINSNNPIQDQMEQLPSLHVADNSLDPGLSLEWLDFLNFNILDQDQGTTITPTTNNNNHAPVNNANANIKDNNYASRS